MRPFFTPVTTNGYLALINKSSGIAGLFLISIVLSVSARPAARQVSAAARFNASITSGTGVAAALQTFEFAITPYFQARAAHARVPSSTYIPQQADYYTLAKHWSQLSPTFLALYAAAVQIPPGLKTYLSPGGHFQIVYSDSGSDAVDMTDTIGYSAADWRIRTHTGNGIPDYVELVAYAADSAWSMEVDRFGFVKPFPYIGNGYASPQFRIYVRGFFGQESSDYALTVPDGPVTSSIGFRSHIEIRNEWNEAIWDTPPIDYKTHPEKAIQVTCVHEFFHTIQYAMTRQIVDGFIPQDFPVSWIEGTAVLMEDNGFNYVHDYLQYVDDYFNDPTTQVLEPLNDGLAVYKNSIVTIYLYQFTADTSCICFIKNMFFNDYQSPIGFVTNLRKSATQSGRTWADLLGNFHTGSYYTGSRAVAGRFIKDAALLPQWYYASDAGSAGTPLTKSVDPFAMNTFSYVHQAGDANTLTIGFLGDSLDPGMTDTNALWSVHCIVKKDDRPADDSIFTLPLVSLHKAQTAIDGWSNISEALVIVTNARYDASRNATVTFQACGTTVRSGETAVFSARSNAPSSAQNAVVTVKATADLSCSLSVATTGTGKQMLDSATGIHLAAAGVFYNLTIPMTWLNNASLSLAISEPIDSIHFGIDTSVVLDSLLSLYRWDNSRLQWQKCAATVSHSADSTLVLQSTITATGIFGLFGRLLDATAAIVAFPNPARLKSNTGITFTGTNAKDSLTEIWIYAIDGSLLAHGANGARPDPSLSKTKYGYSWKLQSNGGKAVSPGVYYACVGYKDFLTNGKKRKAQKVFVIP